MGTNPFKKPQASSGTEAAQVRLAQHQPQNRVEEQFYDENGNYNPRPLGQRAAGANAQIKDAVQASTGRMYDERGQVNAYTKQEAVEKVGYLLSGLMNQPGAPRPKFERRASAAEREQRGRAIQAAMMDGTGKGLHMIGQELALPIKELLDYEGWARNVLRLRSLGQAELFRLPKDVRSTAWTIGQDGQVVESRLRGRYIQPPEFKIASSVTVDIQDIYQLNYDILERAQDTARQEIELEEDKRCVEVLDAAAQTANSITTFGSVGPAALEAIRFQVERHRLRLDKFLVNRNEVSDIVTVMASQLDPVSQRELNLAGYAGNFLGASIMTSAGIGVQEVVPSGTIYGVTEPGTLGEIGERIALFSDPFNKYALGETVKGWMFVEMIGMAIGNSKSVAKGIRA